jgi:hypothetical protein
MDHMLIACVYSREVWFRLLQPVGLDGYLALGGDALITWWLSSEHAGYRLSSNFRRGFDSLLLLVSWLIWKERNSRVFDRSNWFGAGATHIFDH